MSGKGGLLVCWLVLQGVVPGAGWATGHKVLFAFGPGGPHHVMAECAELFHQRSGVTVAVLNSRPEDLAEKLREFGDIYFGGAEYMMEDFDSSNPGILDLATAERLHPRRIGVVVRKGNPLGIDGVDHLGEEGVDLLTVRFEKMEPFHPPGPEGESNVRWQTHSGKEGVAAWRTMPELDAWVTYRSWHHVLEEETDFVEIPCDHALRYTPIALTRRTLHREAAQQFISFLKTPEARRIFEEHGWN